MTGWLFLWYGLSFGVRLLFYCFSLSNILVVLQDCSSFELALLRIRSHDVSFHFTPSSLHFSNVDRALPPTTQEAQTAYRVVRMSCRQSSLHAIGPLSRIQARHPNLPEAGFVVAWSAFWNTLIIYSVSSRPTLTRSKLGSTPRPAAQSSSL